MHGQRRPYGAVIEFQPGAAPGLANAASMSLALPWVEDAYGRSREESWAPGWPRHVEKMGRELMRRLII
jgi:hypothetical protein